MILSIAPAPQQSTAHIHILILKTALSTLRQRYFRGGGSSLYDPLAVIDSCLFKGNSSDYTLIFIITGNFTISNCRFENNVVPSLIYNDGASYVSVIGNAFRYNIGAIFVNNHGLHFRFSGNLIIENSASDDFEYFIIVIDGITTMENNTICNNNALGRHLIILGDEHSYPDMYFNNNIVWDNSVTGSMTFGDNMPLQAIYNDIEGGWPGTGNTNSNPKFVNPDSGDYNLSWANWPIDDSTKSPCIDTGDPNSPLDPDSTRADMGALFYNQRWNDIPDNQRLPDRFILLDNYPNPFNFSTTIRYIVPTTGPVTLDVYDILGRKVRTLLDINQPAGEYRVTWNADKVGTGVYFYRLTTGSNSISRPMILLK
jgi:hypothetical protein